MVNVVIRTVLPLWDLGPIDVFSMLGMIIVQGFGLVPLVTVFFVAALRGMDPRLEEAALASGVPGWQVLRGITIPLLRPHLLAGVVLATIFAVEAFEIPLLLALGADADILATRVYYALNDASGNQPKYGVVGVLGLHFLAITYLLFFAYQRLAGQEQRFAMSSQRKRSIINLRQWRWPSFFFVALFVGVVSVAPLLVLAWTSLHPQYLQPSLESLDSLSLTQYRTLLSDERLPSALGNTFAIGILAPTLGVSVALAAAWVTQRGLGPRAIRVILDVLATSSIAIPGVIAANALLLFYLHLNRILPDWIPLFGTIWVLVLAMSYRIALAYRIERAGVIQIPRDLESAAYVGGVGLWGVLRGIILPLLQPSWIGAWVLLAMVSFRELSLPLVLNRGGPPYVASTLIWELWGSRTGQAAALGTLMVLTVAVLLLAVWWFVWRPVSRSDGR
jgi:iron(III) transport system permease protein